jgi:hypothetical protein
MIMPPYGLKPCMMTIFMHDYAFPPDIKTGLFGLGASIKRRPKDLQIYQCLSMEFVKSATNEQLGSFVKELFNKIEQSKKEAETELH